jgi:rod shape-determining protein MreB
VQGRSLRVGGHDVTKSLQALARKEHDFLLPWDEAERIKAEFLDLEARPSSQVVEARGLCLRRRAPGRVFLDPSAMAQAAVPFADAIIELVRGALEDAPPELVGDVGETGVWLTGGGSLLRGLGERIERTLGLRTRLVPEPLFSVIRGNARLATDAALREACVNP